VQKSLAEGGGSLFAVGLCRGPAHGSVDQPARRALMRMILCSCCLVVLRCLRRYTWDSARAWCASGGGPVCQPCARAGVCWSASATALRLGQTCSGVLCV
jgi:hypothetical protein